MKFRHWFKALCAAVITGCSNSFLSAMGISGANAVGIKIDQLNPKQLATITIIGGLIGAAAYLKQSPVPPDDDPPIKPGLAAALFATIWLCLFTGCASSTAVTAVSPGVSPAKKLNISLVATIAQNAAYEGTKVWLNGLGTEIAPHPDDRDKFDLARISLRCLISAGTFTADDLTAALQSLPIKQLEGASGLLIVDEAVALWDQFGHQLTDLDTAKVFETDILPVAQGILKGLDRALGP